MGFDVTVVVPLFNPADEWLTMARGSVSSAFRAGAYDAFISIGEDLCSARNHALTRVSTKFVCFLDADDALDVDFFEHVFCGTDDWDVAIPSVEVWSETGNLLSTEGIPRVAGHPCKECRPECLSDGNYIVVGAPIRMSLFREVEGFRNYAFYEDWDLFLRLRSAGAKFVRKPSATYLVTDRAGSRNKVDDSTACLMSHGIRRANGLA